MKILLILFLIVSQSCSSTKNLVIWEVTNVYKEVKSNSNDDFALNYMLNKELKGIKIIVKADTIQIQDKENRVIDSNKILKKSNNFYELSSLNAPNKLIRYSLSANKKECIFILPDSSILNTIKIK